MRRQWLCLLLCLCLLINVFSGFAVLAEEAVTTGTVHVSDALRVRDAAGTNGTTVLGTLANNDVVIIHETVVLENGEKWYHITKDSLTGYASAAYITINASYKTDAEFEAYLTAQGFPESYKKGLRDIHAQHPSWIFEARPLTMTWAEALKAETKVGLNTITSPDAWKSMEYGAYNWTTNTYVAYDSGGWVTASPALVAYYMDPRNFLDPTYIFQFEKLTFSGSQTVDGIKAILPDTLDTHAEALFQAAKETNVSAYFLAARMRQEGSQNNGLGTGTVPGYEGYYNFFHFGAYEANGNSAVTNGAIYAKNKGWDTPLKCIKDSADNLARGYIKLGQDTNYLQKFNVTNTTSGLYSHQYMSNTAAAAQEGRIRHNAATADDLNNALVFSIPIYREMPETAMPQPAKTGNNNNFLNNLAVVGGQLTPSFDRYIANYALQVGENVSEITLEATANDAGATITGIGQVALQKGENKIPVTIQSTSGETRTYTVTVTREGLQEPKAVITGTLYTVAETVTKVEPNTPVADFIKNLAVTGGTAAVYTTAGQPKTTGIIGTGDILRLYSGTMLQASYPVVIYGDVNGDGAISSLDLRIAQKHILGVAPISGYQLTAADSGKDGALTSLDLRITQKHILGITKTLQ